MLNVFKIMNFRVSYSVEGLFVIFGKIRLFRMSSREMISWKR